MTFQESEYPDLIEAVRQMEKSGIFSASELLEVMWQLHRQVPIYPGIVKMCLEKARDNSPVSDWQPGDLVAIEKDGQKIIGYVKKISDQKVVLRDGYLQEKFLEKEIVLDAGTRRERLRNDALMRTWPTLVFGKETNLENK